MTYSVFGGTLNLAQSISPAPFPRYGELLVKFSLLTAGSLYRGESLNTEPQNSVPINRKHRSIVQWRKYLANLNRL